MLRLVTILAVVAACSDPSEPTPTPESSDPQPAPEPTGTPAAKSPPTPQPGPATNRTITKVAANANEFHLDPDPEPTRSRVPARPREARPIELVLRSTPPGATAAVDGKAIGKTPAYWQGNADGRPRDVTFALPGYAVSRYRFVAIHSGVVHGSLRKLVKAEPPE